MFGAMWDNCPNCNAVFGASEYIDQECYACGWFNDTAEDNYGNDEPPYPDQDPAAKLCRYCHKTLDNCTCEYVDD